MVPSHLNRSKWCSHRSPCLCNVYVKYPTLLPLPCAWPANQQSLNVYMLGCAVSHNLTVWACVLQSVTPECEHDSSVYNSTAPHPTQSFADSSSRKIQEMDATGSRKTRLGYFHLESHTFFVSRFVTFFSRFYVRSLEYSYVFSDPNIRFRTEVRSHYKTVLTVF